MSLISWLSKRNPKLVDKFEQPKLPGLPDPNNAATSLILGVILNSAKKPFHRNHRKLSDTEIYMIYSTRFTLSTVQCTSNGSRGYNSKGFMQCSVESLPCCRIQTVNTSQFLTSTPHHRHSEAVVTS